MFDLFDLFSASAAGSEPIGRGRATNGEQIAWALAFLVFPTLSFVLWLWASPEDAQLAEVMLFGLPVCFTLVTIWLCRRVGARLAWTIQSALVCFVFCMGAALAAGILGIFGSF
jgi:hypothetical protein